MDTLFDVFYDTLIDGISDPIADKTQDEILSYITHITYGEVELDKTSVFEILKTTDSEEAIIQGIDFWGENFKIQTRNDGDYNLGQIWTDFIFIYTKKPEIKIKNTPKNLYHTLIFTKKDGNIIFVPEGETIEL